MSEEHEIAVEITCTDLPGSKWDERGAVHLAIQKEDLMTIALTNEKGRPVFASVRPDRARWKL